MWISHKRESQKCPAGEVATESLADLSNRSSLDVAKEELCDLQGRGCTPSPESGKLSLENLQFFLLFTVAEAKP